MRNLDERPNDELDEYFSAIMLALFAPFTKTLGCGFIRVIYIILYIGLFYLSMYLVGHLGIIIVCICTGLLMIIIVTLIFIINRYIRK